MHLTSILAACLISGALASEGPATAAGHDMIYLFVKEGRLFGTFKVQTGVGELTPAILNIKLNSNSTILNPDVIPQPAPEKQLNESLFSTGRLAGADCAPNFHYVLQDVTLSAAGLESGHQRVGLIENVYQTMDGHHTFNGDGILGLALRSADDDTRSGFVRNLCNQGRLEECRFGLAMDYDGLVSLILGRVDETLMGDRQNVIPAIGYVGWSMLGKISWLDSVTPDQTVFPASQIGYTVGPVDQVMDLFKAIEATAQPHHLPSGTITYGTYPCESVSSQLSTFLSFAFSPATTSPETHGWGFAETDWTLKQDGDTCTAPIVGWDNIGDNTWYLGQNWLQGKYLDFDLDRSVITVADLMSQSGETTASTQVPSTSSHPSSSDTSSPATTSESTATTGESQTTKTSSQPPAGSGVSTTATDTSTTATDTSTTATDTSTTATDTSTTATDTPTTATDESTTATYESSTTATNVSTTATDESSSSAHRTFLTTHRPSTNSDNSAPAVDTSSSTTTACTCTA